jgi:hypothetical protein
MITLRELIDKLKREDEILLLEVLHLRSEDLVEAFIDRIEERFDELALEFDDTDYGKEKELTGEFGFEDGHNYFEE